MKRGSKMDGLQKSTKLTLVGCACFLALTALIVVFLMFFPIQQTDQTIVVRSVSEPAQTTVAETYYVEEFDWDDLPHTLSTWSAGVNGFHRDLDEFNQTETKMIETTVEKITEAIQTEHEITVTEQESSIIPAQTDMPQTITETKPVSDPEPEEPTAPPMPVMTDAPATEPPDIEPEMPEE